MKKLSLYLIAILIMTFGIKTNVYAIDIQPYWLQSFINQSEFTKTISNTNTSNNYFAPYINFIGGSQNIYNNSKYIYFSINVVNTNGIIQTDSLVDIDFTATCSGYHNDSADTYRITYQDGSTAAITETQWQNTCNQWTITQNSNSIITSLYFH